MKRLIAVLSGLLVLPAFAEVAPIYYDEVIEYSDTELTDDVVDTDDGTATAATAAHAVGTNVIAPVKASRANTSGRTTASRAVASSGARTVAPARTVTSRGASSRNATSARTATATPSRATASRAAAARATVSRSGTTNSGVTTRRATGTSTGVAARAGTTQAPLYIGNSARVGVRTSGNMSSRAPTIRMASATAATTSESTSTSVTDAAAQMDELAQLSDFCKAQYTECMDNFCNVLDDNQGRCSCSKNLKNYAATEAALEKATEELQDVAQKIQYIGLSGDDIDTLFTQTEAELKMQSTSDSSQLKNDLDRIKGLIVDVKSGTASASDSGITLDVSGLLDFTISNTGFDLASLFGMNNADTSSISNQRGEQLYKTAVSRCKAAVLNSCASQGVDITLLTNAYDLEIDKQCVAYERSLTDTNSQMASTVRNAKSVLQKARLMVAQQKNQYDLRGCVNALDSCMQEDFVCGSDYENCLDPTGKYIVNGEIVVGSRPHKSGGDFTINNNISTGQAKGGLYTVWDYKPDSAGTNVWSNGNVSDYLKTMETSIPDDNSMSTNNMMEYLHRKIGWVKDGKTFGMCASYLNKCQDFTYSGGNFQYKNSVVEEYLRRTLVQIKTQQDKILDDYASSCIANVSACLNQNNYRVTQTQPSDAAVNACRAMITTCMSVTGYLTDGENAVDDKIKAWLNNALSKSYTLKTVAVVTSTSFLSDPRTCGIYAGFSVSDNKCVYTPVDGDDLTYNTETATFEKDGITEVACEGFGGVYDKMAEKPGTGSNNPTSKCSLSPDYIKAKINEKANS